MSSFDEGVGNGDSKTVSPSNAVGKFLREARERTSRRNYFTETGTLSWEIWRKEYESYFKNLREIKFWEI